MIDELFAVRDLAEHMAGPNGAEAGPGSGSGADFEGKPANGGAISTLIPIRSRYSAIPGKCGPSVSSGLLPPPTALWQGPGNILTIL